MLPGTRYLSYIHIRCVEGEQLIPLTSPTTYTKCRHGAAASRVICYGGKDSYGGKRKKKKLWPIQYPRNWAPSWTLSASIVNLYTLSGRHSAVIASSW